MVVANNGGTSEAFFNVLRNGSTNYPTTVYLSVLLKPQGGAREGVDFDLPNKIIVVGGATLLTSMTILNNSMAAGNKMFYIQIAAVDNGQIVAPSVLTVTILDANTRKLNAVVIFCYHHISLSIPHSPVGGVSFQFTFLCCFLRYYVQPFYQFIYINLIACVLKLNKKSSFSHL